MDVLTLVAELEKFYHSYGYPLVFISSLVEITPMGWTIPGGTLLAIGGFFSYSGKLSLILVILAGWLGAWITLVSSYILGRSTGFYFVKKFKQKKNAQKAKSLLKRHGGAILTTSMLANMTRFWVAYIAGTQQYDFSKFLFYSGIASLTWSSLLIVIGYIAGSGRTELELAVARLGALGWIVVIIAFVILYLTIRKEFMQARVKEK